MQKAVMQILKAGVLYFALVFGAGFVLGAIRTLWVVPRVGARKGELIEMPLMLVVTIVAARLIVLHFSVSSEALVRLGVGGIALGFMLVAEFGLVLGSKNVWWLGPLQLTAWGENWHKNHHSNPGSARLGLCWWQPDIGWYLIYALESAGFASNVKRPRVRR